MSKAAESVAGGNRPARLLGNVRQRNESSRAGRVFHFWALGDGKTFTRSARLGSTRSHGTSPWPLLALARLTSAIEHESPRLLTSARLSSEFLPPRSDANDKRRPINLENAISPRREARETRESAELSSRRFWFAPRPTPSCSAAQSVTRARVKPRGSLARNVKTSIASGADREFLDLPQRRRACDDNERVSRSSARWAGLVWPGRDLAGRKSRWFFAPFFAPRTSSSHQR